MYSDNKKLLVILGSTSTGKTDLALKLAKKFNGELVSCDSRQVYKGLDIGTGKLPSEKVEVKMGDGFWDMNGIKVWMYDAADPNKQYTVYSYVKDANKVIDAIFKKGKLPIIIGGTGLYLKALLEGLPNLGIPVNIKLRKKLEKLSLQELQARLQKISPIKWQGMNNSDRQNPRRLVRAVELVMSNHGGDPSLIARDDKNDFEILSFLSNVDTLKLGLAAPREVLYQRIDERVLNRINQGMVEEAEKLHREGVSFKRMRQLGLEYGLLADYLEGVIKTKEEFIQKLQWKIHGYARRQVTWFKKEKKVNWFDITQDGWLAKVEREVSVWYYAIND